MYTCSWFMLIYGKNYHNIAKQLSFNQNKLINFFKKEISPCWIKAQAFEVRLVVKNLPAHVRYKKCGFGPWVGKIPWRRAWQSISVLLPGESQGQKLYSLESQNWTWLNTTQHRIKAQSKTRYSKYPVSNVCPWGLQ